jgi:hypothetical protein
MDDIPPTAAVTEEGANTRPPAPTSTGMSAWMRRTSQPRRASAEIDANLHARRTYRQRRYGEEREEEGGSDEHRLEGQEAERWTGEMDSDRAKGVRCRPFELIPKACPRIGRRPVAVNMGDGRPSKRPTSAARKEAGRPASLGCLEPIGSRRCPPGDDNKLASGQVGLAPPPLLPEVQPPDTHRATRARPVFSRGKGRPTSRQP